MSKNFTQFVATRPTNNEPIVLKGSKAWANKQNPNLICFTWPQMRRIAGIEFPKATNTIKATIVVEGNEIANPRYVGILTSARSVSDHVAHFDTMAETRKAEKAAVKTLADARKLLENIQF